jgi:hypothetical protein
MLFIQAAGEPGAVRPDGHGREAAGRSVERVVRNALAKDMRLGRLLSYAFGDLSSIVFREADPPQAGNSRVCFGSFRLNGCN